jgi:hypothetical protein
MIRSEDVLESRIPCTVGSKLMTGDSGFPSFWDDDFVRFILEVWSLFRCASKTCEVFLCREENGFVDSKC